LILYIHHSYKVGMQHRDNYSLEACYHVLSSQSHHVLSSQSHHVLSSQSHHVLSSQSHHVLSSQSHHVLSDLILGKALVQSMMEWMLGMMRLGVFPASAGGLLLQPARER
jgi:hypothetical protein